MSPIPQFVQKLCLHPLILPSILFLIFLYKWINQKPSRTRKLPPSPTKLPILGNLHQLGRFPHRSLHSLSKRYGQVMLIYLGNTPAFVITSARAACEIMKTHDTIFSNRTVSSITKRIIYGGKDLVFSPYGEYWRQIRSICVLQVLSNKKVQSFRNVREEEVSLVVEMIRKSEQKAVNMSEIFVMYSTNVLCRTAYGKKYAGEVGTNFKQLLKDFVEVMAEVKIGDFIPWFGWVDKLTGLEKRVEKVAKEFDQFLQHVVQEHLDRKKLCVCEGYVCCWIRYHLYTARVDNDRVDEASPRYEGNESGDQGGTKATSTTPIAAVSRTGNNQRNFVLRGS